jgi:hypothetical protein
MLAALVNVSVAGLKTSAEERPGPGKLEKPPATRTVPLPRSVAVWLPRVEVMAPAVGENIPVCGSYSSAVLSACCTVLYPPSTRTLPFPRSVAVWSTRAAAMLPVAVNVPVLGS